MNRIDLLYSRKKDGVLSIFFTAGFPQLESTTTIARELESAGVDMIEIGIPFSDPVADGPAIQMSNKLALDNGMTVALLLRQLEELRKTVALPILLMGYLNPVLRYGFEKFCQEAAASGADGLILPDMPLDEYGEKYSRVVEAAHLKTAFLVTPETSESRIQRIDSLSTGFVYAVSASSTTGAKGDFTDEQVLYFERLKGLKLKNPIMIGFGISTHQAYATACRHAAGAIVGSAFINRLASADSVANAVPSFVKELKGQEQG